MTFPLPQFLTENLSEIIYYQNESLISAIAEKYNLNRARLLKEYLFNKEDIKKKLFENEENNEDI